MSAYLNARISLALLTLVCALALLVAACAPAATPTPTTAPTSAPVEEEAEPTEAAVEEEPTEAAEEEAEPTEAMTEAAAEEEPTEAAETEMDATEAADEAATDATEAAGSEAASGEGMPGVVGVTSTRIRETPAVRGTVILEIPQDTAVLALGQTANEGYLFIRLEDGTEGWVSKQTINLEDRFAALPIIEPES